MNVVQFREKNYSQKDIQELAGNGFFVRQIWRTIQGEGPFAGQPAVFIRLAGCNRGEKDECDFCDTDFLMDHSKWMHIKDVLAEVRSYRNVRWDNPLCVITGGEPLLHDLSVLTYHLIDLGFAVQIESNGDYVRSGILPGVYIVVSPKPRKTGSYADISPSRLSRIDALKIVVSADPNSRYHNLPPYFHQFIELKGRNSVFISPMNVYSRHLAPGEVASIWNGLYDVDACKANYEYAASLVQEHYVRLSLQTHIFVSAL